MIAARFLKRGSFAFRDACRGATAAREFQPAHCGHCNKNGSHSTLLRLLQSQPPTRTKPQSRRKEPYGLPICGDPRKGYRARCIPDYTSKWITSKRRQNSPEHNEAGFEDAPTSLRFRKVRNDVRGTMRGMRELVRLVTFESLRLRIQLHQLAT
jgi:hypothetical protein